MIRNKVRSATYTVIKSEGDEELGKIQALVSAFGNVDKDGDRIVEGALKASIEAWKASEDPIPMIWSHNWKDPMNHIGVWDPATAKEVPADGDRPAGLLLEGQIDIGIGNPVADQAYRLLKSRRVKEFSVALDIKREKKASDLANDLLELDLIEAGPCLKGANQMTELVSIKSDGTFEPTDEAVHAVESIVSKEVRKTFKEDSDERELLESIIEHHLKHVLDPDDSGLDLWDRLTEKIKTEVAEGLMTKAQFDEGGWDGDAAMSACVNSPNPAAAFAKVCAGKTEGDPATRDGWRLPHHATPDSPCNVQGAKAALFREPQAPIVNHGAAEAHLQAHIDAYEAYASAEKEKKDAALKAEEEAEKQVAAAAEKAEIDAKMDLLEVDEILDSVLEDSDSDE